MPTQLFSLKKFALYEGFFLGTISTILVFAIRFKLQFLLEDKLPLLFFSLNSTMLTFRFGARIGVATFAIGSVLSFYAFVPPHNSFIMPDYWHLQYFVLIFLLTILILGVIATIKKMLMGFAEHH